MADEIEDYMKWKHEFKLQRFKKIIKGVGMGTFSKVSWETQHKKVLCEIGGACSGWNKQVFDGVFGSCGPIDPFIIWKKHVKQKDFDESLNEFMELYDFDIFE